MEQDDYVTKTVPPWVLLEYQHMRTLAGPDNIVRFTHLSSTSRDALQALWTAGQNDRSLSGVQVTNVPVLDLMKAHQIPLDKVCLLDPKAPEALKPEDGDGRFEWFLFGGILGEALEIAIRTLN
ncbi:hypothetical protein FRB99_001929 [Tulasnella sp. 403]|nr:hypothetical protein FRB99_001929 [Tulasnella sp. 403]